MINQVQTIVHKNSLLGISFSSQLVSFQKNLLEKILINDLSRKYTCIVKISNYRIVGKFDEFGKLSIIRQALTSQILAVSSWPKSIHSPNFILPITYF